jgi:tetratricopeptide (TPR) repeat protein
VRVAIAVAIILFIFRSGEAQEISPEKLFHEAQEAQKRGDKDLAVKKYQELIEQHPEVVAAHANLGVLFANLGRYNEAIREYQVALAEAPDSPPLRLDLGLAYYKKADFPGAAAQFAALHKEQPTDLRIATLLGSCEIELGLAGQALAILLPLEKENSDNLDLEWAVGNAYLRAGEGTEALRRIQKVADQKHSPEAYQLAANVSLRLTFFSDAKRDAEAALALQPNSPSAYMVLGMVEDYSGDAVKAAAEYHKAVELDPKNVQARVQLGAVLVRLRRLGDAREQLDEALTLDGTLSGSWYQLGQVEKSEKNLPAALKDFELAEHHDPQWLAPHIELVALYYRLKRPKDGNREKAIVDQMRADQEKRRAATQVVSPQLGPDADEPTSLGATQQIPSRQGADPH